MKVPFSWLKEYVDIDVSAEELQERLFSCGFEVEELIDLSAGISRVVVGEITSMEKQEGTDHLHVCTVNCGEYGSDLVISTGAPNIFVGACPSLSTARRCPAASRSKSARCAAWSQTA